MLIQVYALALILLYGCNGFVAMKRKQNELAVGMAINLALVLPIALYVLLS